MIRKKIKNWKNFKKKKTKIKLHTQLNYTQRNL
jgi:hypothetical protein